MVEQASLVLSEEHFPDVEKALRKGERGKDEFKEIATAAGVSPKIIDKMWETLLKTYVDTFAEGLPWLV